MLDLSGVNPANLVPFTEDDEIHEDGLYDHIEHLTSLDVTNGLICNGHAGEGHTLTTDEKERVVEIVRDAAGEDTPVVSGVAGGTIAEVVDESRTVLDAGADALLLNPPYAPITSRTHSSVQYVEEVADATDAPIVLFQLAKKSGNNYAPETLGEIIEIDNVFAVKNAVWDVDQYQKDLRAIEASDAEVQVLVGSDEHLLPCYALRADGTILELAAAIPELIADLFYAVQDENMDEAREVYSQMAPFLEAVYTDPGIDGPLRLKEGLVLQGRFPTAHPHEPARPIPDEEVEQLERAMEETGLL